MCHLGLTKDLSLPVVDNRPPALGLRGCIDVGPLLVLQPHADQDQPVADSRPRGRRDFRKVVRQAVQDVARRSLAPAQPDHDVLVAGKPGQERLAPIAGHRLPVHRNPGVRVRRRQPQREPVAVAAAQRVVPNVRVERGIETPARRLTRRRRQSLQRRRVLRGRKTLLRRARGAGHRRERQHQGPHPRPRRSRQAPHCETHAPAHAGGRVGIA